MIGIDIVDIERITRAIERYGERFLDRVLHCKEIGYARGKRKNRGNAGGTLCRERGVYKGIRKEPAVEGYGSTS